MYNKKYTLYVSYLLTLSEMKKSYVKKDRFWNIDFTCKCSSKIFDILTPVYIEWKVMNHIRCWFCNENILF